GDDGCTRSATPLDYSTASSTGRVCRTWNRAYHVANQGDVVRVKNGQYDIGYTNRIADDSSKTVSGSYVTFACGDAGSSEGIYDNNRDTWVVGRHIKLDGGGNWRAGLPSCIRFRALLLGYVTSSEIPRDVVVTGLHVGTIEAMGAQTALISNTEIG